ncbi:DUF1934 domain-containing protein [Haliovirga abyssi]|uniref:DUF1934 domain-containing protein n=1 Tax=Haliovirga abyssi TaxID=2996794 RepID=A0AAU9DTS0_9FUSO|nr:DUF1934 domain-containing protein [Haliovirga abyssi]BDU50589.1 hypothetical protein HLVA_11580 [Haliovirga abyssi]
MELRIKTFDGDGNNFDKVFDTKKQKFDKGIKYEYKDEFGSNIIYVIKNKKIQIKRKGKINSNQLIEKNKKTKFLYKTDYLNKEFLLETKDILIQDEMLEFEYHIYENENLINKIKVLIKEVN